MLRSVALAVGLLAAAPAMAGEMNADEAPGFIHSHLAGNRWHRGQ